MKRNEVSWKIWIFPLREKKIWKKLKNKEKRVANTSTKDIGVEASKSRTHSREAYEKTTKEIIDQNSPQKRMWITLLKEMILKDKNNMEKKKMRKN